MPSDRTLALAAAFAALVLGGLSFMQASADTSKSMKTLPPARPTAQNVANNAADWELSPVVTASRRTPAEAARDVLQAFSLAGVDAGQSGEASAAIEGQPSPDADTSVTGEADTALQESPSFALASTWMRSSAPPADVNAARPAESLQQGTKTGTAAVAVAPKSAQATASPTVVWPAAGTITSYFGPSHPLGIDIGLKSGTPLRAAAAGRIAYVGGDPCCSYGYRVDIDHGNGVLTRYGHLLYLPALPIGQPVRAGDIIGLAGSTGYSTGPHLHFEVRLHDMIVNPLLVLP